MSNAFMSQMKCQIKKVVTSMSLLLNYAFLLDPKLDMYNTIRPNVRMFDIRTSVECPSFSEEWIGGMNLGWNVPPFRSNRNPIFHVNPIFDLSHEFHKFSNRRTKKMCAIYSKPHIFINAISEIYLFIFKPFLTSAVLKFHVYICSNKWFETSCHKPALRPYSHIVHFGRFNRKS